MGDAVIDLYSWPTPNGHKVHILLEEIGLPYRAIPIDISTGAQFAPDFLKVSPNNKVPAIVDPEGPAGQPFALFESGEILIYLAEKVDRFLPPSGSDRYAVLQWLMFQMGSVGPMLGQAHHFRVYAPEKIPYAIDRYTKEAQRLYAVMNQRLGEAPYFAGSEYSIADMSIWPWLCYHEHQGIDLASYPHVKRWYEEIRARPAVQRGLEVLAQHKSSQPFTPDQLRVLFGEEQYKRR
jgi:GST-like protein